MTIKPCPFCASSNVLREMIQNETGWSHAFLACQHCLTQGPRGFYKAHEGEPGIAQAFVEAEDKWNHRELEKIHQDLTEPPPQNSLFIITPRKRGDTWEFTDKERGLTNEPFVGSVNDMIDYLVRDIPKAGKGVNILFSAQKFPGCTMELTQMQTPSGMPPEERLLRSVFSGDDSEGIGSGSYYLCNETEQVGWLCPALLKYFPTPPPKLYVAATALNPRKKKKQ